ncbi:putative alcohol dehydrogenase [Colletotrichum karsti]|uniref:Alcohol dehydrogenase n=1 Tax=Colletotrichum karsti TaxID=1095194 RepID=A0A9P6LH53_9PEZI|nr:putative alcohol dehydrogenase [Colletotrichum karsti]KAF9872265.1 putative alcohol dehydrogenase [Colletotrichum karsti]
MDSDDDDLPTVQRAAVIQNPGPNATIAIRNNMPVGTPGPHEILVRISATGVCGSETRAFRGWGVYDPIVGHEGIGRVVKLGAGVSEDMLGRKVGVKWLYRACGSCSVCLRGHRNNCPKQLNTGKHRPGTLQQYVVADARYVTEIPDGLHDAEVAPLLCAGLTMMGAVSKLKGDLSPGDWVVIQGAAGGLGHLGVQIAAKLRGYRVIAVDGSGHDQFCKDMGAEAFIDYTRDDVEKEVMKLTGEGAHAVIVVPESEDAYRIAPKLARSMGTIVCVGLPHNDFQIPIPVSLCALKALNIKGAMVGTEREMEELLKEAAAGRIRASIDYFHISQTSEIISQLINGEVFGRAVITTL